MVVVQIKGHGLEIRLWFRSRVMTEIKGHVEVKGNGTDQGSLSKYRVMNQIKGYERD